MEKANGYWTCQPTHLAPSPPLDWATITIVLHGPARREAVCIEVLSTRAIRLEYAHTKTAATHSLAELQ